MQTYKIMKAFVDERPTMLYGGNDIIKATSIYVAHAKGARIIHELHRGKRIKRLALTIQKI